MILHFAALSLFLQADFIPNISKTLDFWPSQSPGIERLDPALMAPTAGAFASAENQSLRQAESISLGCRKEAGLFSVFNDVLALLKFYDLGYYQGIEVDFGERGIYYDPKIGPNWWNYYCEPICYGEKINIQSVIGDVPFSRHCEAEKHTTREEGYYLINKYIRWKPELQQKIDQLQDHLFQDRYIIGVHYRGTDKMEEARIVPYKKVLSKIIKHLKEKVPSHYKIFVATDEEPFLNYLKSYFGEKVCCTDAMRATTKIPIHLNNSDPYKCGEEAIIDAVLLSRTNFLIRTSSNLSFWSLFLNPNLPVVELNHRY